MYGKAGQDTFDLGYEPTLEEISSVNLKKKGNILLPKPIPLLNQSFSKASIAQESEEAAEDSFVEGFKNLFISEEVECNVILEDYIETPTSWDAEPGDAFRNWTCTPFLVLQESW
ncbi:hypothetical protein HAX54_052442 [Datura stramonium]|uniref:Uncharacterized protein n=1 Tax=Datura stramonium TaxID=4076 RepID=A0ABS8SZW5_DATST|nr:hypothetical protein [Datura stramonium]